MPRAPQVHLVTYPTTAGTRWKLRWHAGGRDQEEGGFSDKAAAEVRQAQILTELRHNGTPLSARGRQKLSEFAEHYLATANLAPNTVARYRGLVKLNIDATVAGLCLGQLPLKKVTVEAVAEWYQAVKATRGQMEAAKAYRCLSGIMTEAIKRGEIYTHPCQVKGGSKETSPPRKLPDDDVPALLFDAFMNYRDHWGRASRACYATIPVLIGYGTAMRKSEVRGLRRRDIDLDEGTICVERQAYYRQGNGWDTEALTKSSSGRRKLWIEGPALDALAWHMETFLRPTDEDPEGEDLVFTAKRGGGPLSDTGWQNAWAQAKADAGVSAKLNLHDLRHKAATTVAQDQKEIKVIQEFLGDSTATAALRYLHATDESKKAVASSMAKRYQRFNPWPTESTDNVVPIRRASHAR
jgi:integrase